eukprot:TRINITY_DN62615_c0_g1_i1.p1 TRINITY_DN62615_c0_g1~~TRINITY_DN62615_c0_g1_i1.p1  ORF type:complete len:247 (-),score=27.73 TRINITY_DN62615_c0_g1_i1:199-870(-)
MASVLQTSHGWRAQVRKPDFEVRVLIGDSELLVDIPLLFQGAVKIGGGELCEAGLSAPVAWAMGRTANLIPGDKVLDPMCGKAVILVEGALSWPSCHFIGFEIDSDQVRGGARNVDMLAASSGRVDLFHGDARQLPLPSNSVDAVVCDIPFGRQYSTIEECRNGLYGQSLLSSTVWCIQRLVAWFCFRHWSKSHGCCRPQDSSQKIRASIPELGSALDGEKLL